MNARRTSDPRGTRGRRCLAVLAALLLLLAFAPSASAAPKVAGPTLFVDPDADTVSGSRWGADEVTLSDVTSSAELGSLSPVGGVFEFASDLPIREGQVVRATDGTTSLSVTVTALSVRAVDPIGNTVNGTAERNTKVSVAVGDGTEVDIKADGTGAWVATEAVVGEVIIGTMGTATQYATADTGTRVAWGSFLPAFRVAPANADEGAAVFSPAVGDRLGAGYQWPADTDLTITVERDGQALREEPITTVTDANGEFAVGPLPRDPYDLKAGDVVTVETGDVPGLGVITKTLEVSGLTVTAKDPVAETIAGTAVAGSDVYVQPTLSDEPVGCTVTADESGLWEAVFADVGVCPAFDLGEDAGSMGYAAQADEDLDATHVSWHFWAPNFQVDPERDAVSGVWWSGDAGLAVDEESDGHTWVTVTIDGAEGRSWTALADGREASFEIDLGADGVDVVPGDFVTVQAETAAGSTFTRTHTVLDVRITAVDNGTDVVTGLALDPTGTAAAGGGILVVAYDNSGGAQRLPVITQEVRNPAKDVVGGWTADFGAVGTELGSSENTFDITDAATITAGLDGDDGGGTTVVRPGTPAPQFFVDPSIDAVWGFEWTPNADLSVSADGTAFPVTSGDDGYFWLDLSGEFDIQAGHTVVVSDGAEPGSTTKDTVVTALAITDVNVDADTVSGLADRKTLLTVGVYNDEGGTAVEQRLTPAQTTWTVYFGNFGDIEGIDADTIGYASQSDADGDATYVDWAATPVEPPTPVFYVAPATDIVWGFDWAPGTVSVSVGGTGVGSATVDETGWFELDLGGLPATFDVVPGQTVAVSDGTSTKFLAVAALTVTGVDVTTDDVSGATDGTGELVVGIWSPEGASAAEVRPEVAESWTADFTGLYDIDEGTAGYAGQADEDGDSTWVDWAAVPSVP